MVGQAGPARLGVWGCDCPAERAVARGRGVSTCCSRGPGRGTPGEVRILGSEGRLVLGLPGLSPEPPSVQFQVRLRSRFLFRFPVFLRFPPKPTLGSFECFCLHILELQKVAKKNSGVEKQTRERQFITFHVFYLGLVVFSKARPRVSSAPRQVSEINSISSCRFYFIKLDCLILIQKSNPQNLTNSVPRSKIQIEVVVSLKLLKMNTHWQSVSYLW